MLSFCPYITFTIVSLCQWNTIASYGKCLLVIRRCLKLYPVSMPVRCDIDLTVIFKSCRALYCLSIPIPFIMPNRLTGAPYLASRSFARLRPAFMLISFTLRTFPILWWLFISLHLLQLLYSPARRSVDNVLCGLRSTIIFTFSIIPYLILFVKHYFRNQHSDYNTIFTKIHIIISLKKL